MTEPPSKRRRITDMIGGEDIYHLHRFAYAGDVAGLRAHLASHKPSQDALMQLDTTGFSPLHFASEHGHFSALKLLVEYAITKFESLSAFLDHKTSPDQCSAVLLACQQGHFEIIQYLVHAGADVNARNRNSFNCLHAAIKYGHTEVVQYLVQSTNVKVREAARNGQTVLHTACGNGHVEIAQFLIDTFGFCPRDLNTKGWNCLHFAVKHGHLAMVEFLTTSTMVGACGVVTSRHGCSPLFIACQEGFLPVLRFLYERAHADPQQNNSNGWNPLHIAAKNGHLEVIRYLLEKAHVNVSAKTQNSQCTPFFIACQCGNTEIARYLYRYAPYIKSANTVHGNSVLHIAAQNGHLDTIRFLCDEANIPPTVQNSTGHRPIVYACKGGHIECIRVLADRAGFDPFPANNTCMATCLAVARSHNHMQVVEWLQTCGDWTPVMRAVDMRDPNMVKARLLVGMSPHTVTPNSRLCALDIALNRGNPSYALPVCEVTLKLISDAVALWSPDTNYIWPHDFRQLVFSVLLVERRYRWPRSENSSGVAYDPAMPSLPKELWLMVLEHVAAGYHGVEGPVAMDVSSSPVGSELMESEPIGPGR